MGSEAVDVGGSPAPRCSDAALAEKIDTRETPGPAPVERCIPNTQNQNVPGCGNGATDQETFIVRGTSFPLERRWGNQAGGNNLWLEDDLPSTPSFTSTPNSGEGPRTPPTTLSVDGVWPYLSYTPAQENSGPPTPSFNSYSSSVGVDETASIKGSLTPDFIEILSSDEDDARKGSRGVTSAELHREGSAPSSNSSNLARGRQMGREIGSASKEANVASQQVWSTSLLLMIGRRRLINGQWWA